MEFSVLGLLVGIVLLAPSFLILPFPPRGPVPSRTSAGIAFTVLERAGQAGCLVLLALSGMRFADWFNPWFVPMAACTIAYYVFWARYLVLGRDSLLLFGPWRILPMPLALLPVLAFGFAAPWTGSLWLGIAAVLLAIGHWTNSWVTYRSLPQS
ncbi:hypothetical protein BH11ACT4_BH11ACT4_15330 [soil metagenome]